MPRIFAKCPTGGGREISGRTFALLLTAALVSAICAKENLTKGSDRSPTQDLSFKVAEARRWLSSAAVRNCEPCGGVAGKAKNRSRKRRRHQFRIIGGRKSMHSRLTRTLKLLASIVFKS